MKAFVRFVQRQAERQLRVPADYLRQLGDTSFSGFLKFLMILPVAAHRRRSDPALVHAVRIAATQDEDCGPCVQIAVNAAIDDGVEPDIIRAVLARNRDQMPKEVALVLKFAEGVLARDGSEEEARDEIVRQLGQTVVTELSLAIATARVFPSLKRGLGFARSCALVEVAVESGGKAAEQCNEPQSSPVEHHAGQGARATGWIIAYWMLTAAFLLTTALNLLHVRAGFLTNYLADLTLPAWLYVLSRGLVPGQSSPVWRWMPWIGRTPESAAIFFFLASSATEFAQIIWPKGLFAGRFDPWDIAAYGVGLLAIYICDKFQGTGRRPSEGSAEAVQQRPGD